jgi:hypothetical protein
MRWIKIYDFAFVVAVSLIVPLLGVHHYFGDKIRKKLEKEKEKYSETIAKAQIDGLKNLIEHCPHQSKPPYDELKKYYSTLCMKQFDGLGGIAQALRLENFLNNTMFLFFVAVTLFFFTGVFPYISISDFSFSVFSIPSMISGVISIIMACFRIYQIGKEL